MMGFSFSCVLEDSSANAYLPHASLYFQEKERLMKRLNAVVVLVVLAVSIMMILAFSVRVVKAGLVGDIDNDGKVNLKDAFMVLRAYGSSVGDLKYDAKCDLNGSGKIDMMDLKAVFANFGKTST
jgi:uncharacterized membrane protein